MRRERESDLDRRSPVPLDPEELADLEAQRKQLEAQEGRVLQNAGGELDTSPLAGPERNRLENAWREVHALYQTSLDSVEERAGAPHRPHEPHRRGIRVAQRRAQWPSACWSRTLREPRKLLAQNRVSRPAGGAQVEQRVT